jgi:hypothetical protein
MGNKPRQMRSLLHTCNYVPPAMTFGSRVELVGGPLPTAAFEAFAMTINRKSYGIGNATRGLLPAL